MKIEDLLNHFTNRDTVTQPSHQKTSERRKLPVGERPYQDHRSRSETETLIKNTLKEAGREMTVIELARVLNRTASPHFRKIVTEMVDQGLLVQTAVLAPNERLHRFLYKLP